jgi:vacuolar-type H+-ATPase catalytic subunit A/Vma1
VNNSFVTDSARRLRDDLARYKKWGKEDELAAQLARYLAIRIAGFVEVGFRRLLVDYSRKRGTPSVVNYVSSQLEFVFHPNSKRIEGVLRLFESSWGDAIVKHFDDNPDQKDAIDAIMNIRNNISHGKSHGITLNAAGNYLLGCEKVLEKVEKIIGGNP